MTTSALTEVLAATPATTSTATCSAWTTDALETLAAAVAADGVSAHLADVLCAAVEPAAAALPPAVLAVLSDAAAPEVARQRAFGRLHATLLASA
jgi:hypothetical protein